MKKNSDLKSEKANDRHTNRQGNKQSLTANVLAEQCPSRDLLRHVTGRWGLLVFWALRDAQKHRFSELRRTITGVSEKMLAQTLQQLEYDGFVERIVYPVVPPHVEYQLTPLGEEFNERVKGLMEWIEGNLGRVMDSRARADKLKET